MIKVLFSDRVKIQDMFDAWCVKNQATGSIHNLIAFMEQRGWLNDEKILRELKEA